MSEIRIADLFAGIGGIRMGMVQALGDAAHVVYSSEWNKYSVQTYEANWHDENPVAGDITKVDEHDVPDIDLLLAGFPCQPFSIAGVSKKQSMGRPTGFEDKTQGTLFFDVARIIKAKQPKAFLLENVKNLLSHDREGDLLGSIGEFPRVVASAAELREPHRVARYLEGLATAYHRFYDVCRVLPRGDEEVSDVHRSRLVLCAATRQVLANGLDLLGVSAPERM